MIKPTIVDEIINTARIEEVIGDFITLKKRGANLMGLCPFHNEKSPSFTVSPAKGIYKCFGCGKAGNSVGFIMEHESLAYPDALRYLARRYNIDIAENEVDREQVANEAARRDSLYVVLDFAAKHFSNMLEVDPVGSTIGKSYFIERGFREDTIKRFGLGYSKADWRGLTDLALAAGYKLEFLQQTGLTKVNEDGKMFDMFRDRVMFPIHNLTGRVVAFGGRQLKKEENSPKYVNSPETEVYHKSDILYGLYFARQAIKKTDRCYLVEGYTDVITLSQSGIENVVASSGTSLTDGQIKLIKRFTDNVTVLYDGDAAGIRASLRGIDMLLGAGLNVRVATFPDGDDPDSYCRKVGGAAFSTYLEQYEQDFVLFKSGLLFESAGNDPVKKAEAVRDLVESIARIPDPLKRSVYVKECSRLADMDERLLLVELNKIRHKDAGSTTIAKVDEQTEALERIDEEIRELLHPNTLEEQEKAIVRLLVMFSEKPFGESNVGRFIIDELAADEAEMENPVFQKLITDCAAYLQKEALLPQQFFINHEEQQIMSLAAGILALQIDISPYWSTKFDILVRSIEENYQQDVVSVLNFFRLRKLDQLINQNLEKIKEETNEEILQSLQLMHKHLHELRQQFSKDIGAIVVK